MDVKSLPSCSSTDIGESALNFLKRMFNENNVSPAGNMKQDALEAVKLDPAVLEAQVTVHTNDEAVRTTNSHRNLDVITEDNTERQLNRLTPPPEPATSQCSKSFKDMVQQQEAALLSLTPHQLEVLMKYADVLRRQRTITQKYLECAFCKNNGKPSVWYMSHALRDARGRVKCPILRAFHCRRCGATGDQAHTIKYCPELTDTQSSSGKSSF